MNIKGKGKYDGKKRVELEQELGLPPDTEIFFTVEEIKSLELNEKKITKNKNKEHAFIEIAKLAKHFGRRDLSEKHHEILGELIE